MGAGGEQLRSGPRREAGCAEGLEELERLGEGRTCVPLPARPSQPLAVCELCARDVGDDRALRQLIERDDELFLGLIADVSDGARPSERGSRPGCSGVAARSASRSRAGGTCSG